jgi:general secretion pathway protein G
MRAFRTERPGDGGLLIVTLIGVILGSAGLALYSSNVEKAHEAALKQDLLLMREALDQYHADKNKYPVSLEALVDERYLRAVPADPFTNSTKTWRVVMPGPTGPACRSCPPRNPASR